MIGAFQLVIPGQPLGLDPESIITGHADSALSLFRNDSGYGFRARRFAMSRNDDRVQS
jgi:hypothetical protein